MTPLISEMVKIAPDPELMQWFDASSIPPKQTVNLDVVNDTPLPFDKCAVVGVDGDAKWLMLLNQVEDVVGYTGWTLHKDHHTPHPALTYIRTPEGVKVKPLDEDKEEATPEVIRGLLATVGAWLLSLSPGAVAYAPKARKSLINSKRAAKGKSPALFDWHTVEVSPPTLKSDHQGGTHASPRLHDRRGHWRTIKKTGKRVWVRNCKVGDASKGVVFKDYKIGNTA
jgi:hypothetical protein